VSNTGEIRCDHASSGYLCDDCLPQHYHTLRHECEPCVASATLPSIVSTIVGVLVILVLLIMWNRGKLGVIAHAKTRLLHVGVVAVVKMVFGYYQVLLLLGSVYNVPYPAEYLEVLSHFTLFSLDAFLLFPAECIIDYDFLSSFYAQAIAAMCLLLVIVLIEAVARGTGWIWRRVRQVQAVSLFVTYCIYSSTSTTISKIFNCKDIDEDHLLLSEDYTVDCRSMRYLSAHTFGVFSTLTVSLGTPVLYLILMMPYRSDLSKAKHLQFFHHDYVETCFFWEVVECMKRYMLTGAALFVSKGSLLQLILSVLVALSYGFVLRGVQPYTRQWHNTLAVTINWMLVVSLLLAMLLKMSTGFTSNGIYTVGVSPDDLPLLLVASLVLVLFVCVSTIVWELLVKGSVVHNLWRELHQAFVFSDVNKTLQRSRDAHGVSVLEEMAPTRSSKGLRWLASFIQANERPLQEKEKKWISIDSSMKVQKIGIVQSPQRLQSFVNKYLEYQQKYANKAVFQMSWVSEQGPLALCQWRLRIVAYFARYPSWGPSSQQAWSCGDVRVCVAFRGEWDEVVAKAILFGNLSNLAARDPGYYGTGLYFSLDPEYCVRYYGTDKDDKPFKERVLAIYAVCFGNMYPVTEGITEKDRKEVEAAKTLAYENNADINYCSQESLLGRPLKAKADSHVVIVGIEGSRPETTKGVWRKMPSGHQYHGHAFQAPVDPTEQQAFHGHVRSELVLRDESQVMPLGYMVITDNAPISMSVSLGSVPTEANMLVV